MNGAWRCDSCEANNEADATECRLCHQVPGTASGTAARVQAAFVPTATTEPRPEFTESKHSQFRQRPRPATPRPPLGGTPPPPRRPAPVRPASGAGRAGPIVGMLVLATVVIIAFVVGLNRHGSSSDVASTPDVGSYGAPAPVPGGAESEAPSESPEPAGPPCPDAVARYLPDVGSGSILVAAYTSTRYTVTLCEADDGQLYYDGQLNGAPASNTTHISIPAQETSYGYTASNNGYTYEVTDAEEQLVHGGRVIEDFQLTRTGP